MRNRHFGFSLGLCAVPFLCTVPLPAKADWQFTKWGMSVNDVMKASKGIAKVTAADAAPNDKVRLLAKLAMPYTTGAFAFDATFYFDAANRLQSVHLELEKGDRHSLLGSLSAKYGEPESQSILSASAAEIDVWRTSIDQIIFSTVGDDRFPEIAPVTFLDYRPRSDAANKGL